MRICIETGWLSSVRRVALKRENNQLKEQDGTIEEFDSALWGSMVEYITVSKKKEITVTFRNGTEILA